MAALSFPEIDPILFSLGPIHIRWYGLMYVLGFLASYFLVRKQIRDHSFDQLEREFENLNLVLILSVVLGGRLGYVLFYNFSYYLENPLEIPATWSGGMSFHGACFFLLIAGYLFCRIKKLDFWKTADLYGATIPVGLFLGRVGNFINGELYGRTTSADFPLGMVFPGGGPQPRHPSQLYEAVCEGLILFIVLWSIRNKPWQKAKYLPHGSIAALFWIGYGIMRIVVENFREPDAHLGFLFGTVTMGQMLSAAMIGCGLAMWGYRLHRTRI